MQIRREIREEVAKLPKNLLRLGELLYFNNLHLNLPGETRRSYPSRVLDARILRGKTMTPREFHSEIDVALREANVNMSELSELMKNYRDAETRKRIFDLVFPAYVILIGKGYEKQDLTS